MPESQDDIDALLADVSSLADEAAADIVGDGSDDASDAAQSEDASSSAATTAAPAASAPPAPPPAPKSKPPLKQKIPSGRDVERILKLEVPVIVQLAETMMPMSQILGLSTGAIIEFEKPSDSTLNLMINNKVIGEGQAVKVGENFGLRVTEVGTVKERVEAMSDG